MKAFLEENKHLFWHFDKTKLDRLSDDVIVEYILNYGSYNAVKTLLKIMGVNPVAEIFFRNAAPDRRINYFPEALHFFNLYFKRHASGDFKQRAVGTASFGQKIPIPPPDDKLVSKNYSSDDWQASDE